VLARLPIFVAMTGLFVVIAPARHSRPALPCPNPMSVAVTPDGDSQQWGANTNGHAATYWVKNTGACNDTYTFTSSATGPIAGVSLNKTSAAVAVANSTSVVATYNVGAAGTGILKLKATGNVLGSDGLKGIDSGYFNITVIPAYQVAVTPDGSTTPTRGVGVAFVDSFLVQNTGANADTYTLTCSASSINCNSVSPVGPITLSNGSQQWVGVNYTPTAPGTGSLKLNAASAQTGDSGNYVVPIVGCSVAVSVAPNNGGTRSVDPFDVVQTVTAPAYQSLQQPRAVTLVYNSSTVRPTPVVSLNISAPSPCTAYQLQVQLISNSTYLTLLNGATSVYYAAPPDTSTTRLVAAIDAKNNNLSSGWYDVNVIVTPYINSTPSASTTVTTRVLVDDETTSLFGAGWQVAGLQRLYTMSGSYSALITNGDGSMSFFRRDCSTCAFISPAGDPTRLALYTGPDTGITYRRAAPDSSAIDFRSDGRMVRAWSGELYRPTVLAVWSGTQLTSIQDVIGKRLTFGYTGPASQSGKLQTITDPLGRVTTIWTDTEGKLYLVTDPDGLTTGFAYDASLHLTSVTGRGGAVTNLTYDGLNRVDSIKAPAITDYTGSLTQPITTMTAAERIAWQPATAGNSLGAAKAVVRPDTLAAMIVDPLGNLVRLAYDRFAGVTKIIDPLGQVTTIQRDTLGQVTGFHTPTGQAGTRTYYGYLLTSTYDSTTKQSTTYIYNGFNRIQTVTGNGGATRTDYYYKRPYPGAGDFGLLDSVYLGNTGSHSSPTGGYLAAFRQYNAWGQDSIITDGAGHQTTTLYSDTANFSNAVQVTDPYGRTVRQAHYDGAGRPDTVWSPSNGTLAPLVLSYDQLNRTRTIKDSAGALTQYIYGPTTLSRILDAKGQIYRFDYNALGWTTIRHDLADTTKADTLRYDVGGRVRTVRTRRGDTISLTYDPAGRLLTRSGPDFPVDSFRYDPAGRWVVATNANAYDSLAYDIGGRLVNSLERLAGDSSYVLTFTYDTLGRVKTRSAPRLGSPQTFGYNPGRGTLDTMCAAGQCSVWAGRDADNIPHVLGLGVNNAQHFQMNLNTDNTHRIVSDSFSGPTSYAQQLDTTFAKTWTYDTLGRVTNERPYASTWGEGGFRYDYDSDGRLRGACLDQTSFSNGELHPLCTDEYGQDRGWGLVHHHPYDYDSTGNRTDSMAAAVVGPGNRMAQFKGYTLAYDLNGNTISKKGLGGSLPTDTTLFTWDAASRLTRVERWTGAGAHTIVTYAYDALDRRVAKTVGGTTERYVHDGDQVILDIDGASHSLKAEYTWAPGAAERLLYIRTSGWTAGAITDPQNGTVRGFADLTNGQPMKQYPASYWGEVGPDTGFVVRFRHAGREYDAEARVYYNRARYYDPQLGRFISEDPVGIAGGLNLYGYAGNDPVNRTDPTGLTMNPCPSGYDWSEIWYYDNNGDGDYDDGDTLVGAVCDKMGGGGTVQVGGNDHGGGSRSGNVKHQKHDPVDVGVEAEKNCRTAIAIATATAIVDVLTVGLLGNPAEAALHSGDLLLKESASLSVRGQDASALGASIAGFSQLGRAGSLGAGENGLGVVGGLVGVAIDGNKRVDAFDLAITANSLLPYNYSGTVSAVLGAARACFAPE